MTGNIAEDPVEQLCNAKERARDEWKKKAEQFINDFQLASNITGNLTDAYKPIEDKDLAQILQIIGKEHSWASGGLIADYKVMVGTQLSKEQQDQIKNLVSAAEQDIDKKIQRQLQKKGVLQKAVAWLGVVKDNNQGAAAPKVASSETKGKTLRERWKDFLGQVFVQEANEQIKELRDKSVILRQKSIREEIEAAEGFYAKGSEIDVKLKREWELEGRNKVAIEVGAATLDYLRQNPSKASNELVDAWSKIYDRLQTDQGKREFGELKQELESVEKRYTDKKGCTLLDRVVRESKLAKLEKLQRDVNKAKAAKQERIKKMGLDKLRINYAIDEKLRVGIQKYVSPETMGDYLPEETQTEFISKSNKSISLADRNKLIALKTKDERDAEIALQQFLRSNDGIEARSMQSSRNTGIFLTNMRSGLNKIWCFNNRRRGAVVPTSER